MLCIGYLQNPFITGPSFNEPIKQLPPLPKYQINTLNIKFQVITTHDNIFALFITYIVSYVVWNFYKQALYFSNWVMLRSKL